MFGLFRKTRRAGPALIAPRDAYDRLRAGALVLIDVREPDERARLGAPDGAVGVALQDPDFTAKALAAAGEPPLPVATSCRTGSRSQTAAARLIDAGLTDVSVVKGGFEAWRKAGLPISTGPL